MKFTRLVFSFLLSVLLLSNFAELHSQNFEKVKPAENKARYIFYFIGDGMGLAHVAITEAYLASVNEKEGFDKMNFSSFPAQGFATTYAGNRFITGSAAAGTAMATGRKTTINTIGMNDRHDKDFKSVAQSAKDVGLKVGIISSVSIDHATPACFYAHQSSRNMYYEISLELPLSGFDFFGGGCFKNPYGNGENDISSFDWAKEHGYKITQTKQGFEGLQKGDEKVIACGSPLGQSGEIRYVIDHDESDIPLEDFVEKAIELLDNEKGFFIMIEEGKIDWAAHSNDIATVIHNVISLGKAVDVALDFYQKHPDETLIIVTADHETGGLALGWAGTQYHSDYQILKNQIISQEKFSAVVDSIVSIDGDTETAFNKIMLAVKNYFGLGDAENGTELSERETEMLKNAFKAYCQNIAPYSESNYLLYGGCNPVAMTTTKILNNKAGIGWTSFSHTGIPVPVFAIGTGHELFNGYYDNTDIPKKIMRIMVFQ